MQTVADFLDALGRRAPLEKAAAWDPVGLQLGDVSARVERVAVCHEVTQDVVARLEQDPVDLLVSYHPLLFRATNTLRSGATPEGGPSARSILYRTIPECRSRGSPSTP